MKWIADVKVKDVATLEVFKCGCGFHIGLDASYLLQVGSLSIECPSCMTTLNTLNLED